MTDRIDRIDPENLRINAHQRTGIALNAFKESQRQRSVMKGKKRVFIPGENIPRKNE